MSTPHVGSVSFAAPSYGKRFFSLLLENQDRVIVTPSLCHSCQKARSEVSCCGGGRLSQLNVSGKNIGLPTLVFDSCVFIHAPVVWGFIASFLPQTFPGNRPLCSLPAVWAGRWPGPACQREPKACGDPRHIVQRDHLGARPGLTSPVTARVSLLIRRTVRPSRAWWRREMRLLSCAAQAHGRRGQCLCPSEWPRVGAVRAGLLHVWPSQGLGSEGFNARSHHLETLNHFISACVFCK